MSAAFRPFPGGLPSRVPSGALRWPNNRSYGSRSTTWPCSKPRALAPGPHQRPGIVLAAQAMADDLPVFRGWLLDVLSDTRLQPAGRFQELIYQHVRVMLGGDPAPSDCRSADDAAVLALAD